MSQRSIETTSIPPFNEEAIIQLLEEVENQGHSGRRLRNVSVLSQLTDVVACIRSAASARGLPVLFSMGLTGQPSEGVVEVQLSDRVPVEQRSDANPHGVWFS